jgi:hypothetical protein
MANQKARIGITMAIAMIIAMTTNKPNAISMYPEPDSQPNPAVSASIMHTEVIKSMPRNFTSLSVFPLVTRPASICDSCQRALISR